jgi:hypothetical protein
MLGFAPTFWTISKTGGNMAKRKEFNLSETIREFRKTHPKTNAREAFEAISKSSGQKINEGTFKSTFYKLVGGGKRRTVRRAKPLRRGAGDGAGNVIGAALIFIRAAGGIPQAKQVLMDLESVKEL